MIFNNEKINNVKEAKDVVAAYLFDRAYCYSFTKKTTNGTRHDVEMYRDDLVLKFEVKTRKKTEYKDYKIEYSKIEYLETLKNAFLSVIALDKGGILSIPLKRALEKGFMVEKDLFPVDNDKGRWIYKECEGFHIRWEDFSIFQPLSLCEKYQSMVDKACSLVGKTDTEIICALKRIAK